MNFTSHVESWVLERTVGVGGVWQEPLLQPLWDYILANGQPYCAHWLFAGWLTFAGYMLVCMYFTYKGSFGFFLLLKGNSLLSLS
jgi:hypothetical protein